MYFKLLIARNHFPGDGTVSKTDFYNFWNQVGVIVSQIKTESLISSNMIYYPHVWTIYFRRYMLKIFYFIDSTWSRPSSRTWTPSRINVSAFFLFTSKFLNCTCCSLFFTELYVVWNGSANQPGIISYKWRAKFI